MCRIFFCFFLMLFSCKSGMNKSILHSSPTFGEDYNAKALGYLDSKLAQGEGGSLLYYQKAKFSLLESDTSEAILSIKKALEFESSTPLMFQFAAKVYSEANQFDNLINLGVANQSVKDPDFLLNVAEAAFISNQDSLGREFLALATSVGSRKPSVLSKEADLYLLLGDTTKAENLMSLALKGKYSLDVFLTLFDIYLAQGVGEKAKSILQKNRALLPENDEAVEFRKALLYELLGENKKAKDIFVELYRADTLNLSFLNHLAGNQYYLNQYDSALYYAEKVLIEDKRNFGALHTKARAKASKFYYSSAIQIYKRLVALDTANAIVQKELNQILKKRSLFRKQKNGIN